MSYREIRALAEQMCSLGYPNLISVESFRSPNFELVCDLLLWMVKSYDPNVNISKTIQTEQDRVQFIKHIAQFLATRAQLKLNTKKLYLADANAVKELLKLSNVFFQAQKKLESENPQQLSKPLDISSALLTIKTARELATELTTRGATLYDLLLKELDHRSLQSQTLSRAIDLSLIKTSIHQCMDQILEETRLTQQVLETMQLDRTQLESKLLKKKQELERREKRFLTMQHVRPAYMDEFEKIEIDLKLVYRIYNEKLRNLSFLEQQAEELMRLEQTRVEETEMSLKRMQERIKEEELKLLKGETSDDFQTEFDLLGSSNSLRSRPKAAMSGKKGKGELIRSTSRIRLLDALEEDFNQDMDFKGTRSYDRGSSSRATSIFDEDRTGFTSEEGDPWMDPEEENRFLNSDLEDLGLGHVDDGSILSSNPEEDPEDLMYRESKYRTSTQSNVRPKYPSSQARSMRPLDKNKEEEEDNEEEEDSDSYRSIQRGKKPMDLDEDENEDDEHEREEDEDEDDDEEENENEDLDEDEDEDEEDDDFFNEDNPKSTFSNRSSFQNSDLVQELRRSRSKSGKKSGENLYTDTSDNDF